MRTHPDHRTAHAESRFAGCLLRPAAAPELRFCTIHGYRRAYRVAGSGPVILLIHGIGDNSSTWAPVQSRLAQRFTVLAPDLLGHGQSEKPRGGD